MVDWLLEIGQRYAGEILGILGVLLAIIFYLKSRKIIGASYYISTNRLIGPMGPTFHGLEIMYKGTSISSFSSSKIYLWNQGTEAIRKEDIAPSAPLAITLQAPETVLDHKVLYCSSRHTEIGTALIGDDGQVFLTFDFLDPKQGAIIEVLHTGSAEALSVSGSIIGGGDIVKKQEARADPKQEWKLFFTVMSVLLIVFVTAVAALFAIQSTLSGYSFSIVVLPIGLFILVLFMTRVLPKLDPLWFGGFMVKRLSDGYAKQDASEHDLRSR